MSRQKSNHLDQKTLFWSAIIGFMLGAIVWLLRVPRTGRAIREQIIDRARTMIGRSSEEDNAEEALNKDDDAPAHSHSQKYGYFR